MSKRLLSLTLLLIAAVGVGYWVLQQQALEQPTKQLIFKALSTSADNLSEVRVSNGQTLLLIAKKRDDGWVATHLDEGLTYPVDQGRLSTLVSRLIKARLLEAKTSRTENYVRLGVESLDTVDSQSTLLELSAADKVWQLLVGNTAKSGHGSYVRIPRKKQSWLLDTSLELPTSPSDWLQQPILTLDDAQVASVELSGEKGWKISKSEPQGEDYQLQDQPNDRKLQYPSVLQGVVSSITNLRFEQLTPFVEERWQTLKQEASLKLTTFDGQLFYIDLASQQDKHFVHISGGESHSGYQQWQFEISDFAAGQLSRGMENFLAEPTEPESDGPSLPQGQ